MDTGVKKRKEVQSEKDRKTKWPFLGRSCFLLAACIESDNIQKKHRDN